MSRLINIFKKKLEEREFEFDEGGWKDLEKQLDLHSPKPGIKYLNFIAASAGISLLVAGLWLFYPSAIEEKTAAKISRSEVVGSPEKKMFENENTSADKSVVSEIPGKKPAAEKIISNNSSPTVTDEKAFSMERNSSEPDNFLEKASTSLSSENKKSDIADNNETGIENKKPEILTVNETAEVAPPSEGNKRNDFTEKGDIPGKPSGESNQAASKNEEAISIHSFPDNAEIKPMIKDLLMEKISFTQFQDKNEIPLAALTERPGEIKKKPHFFAGIYSGIAYTDKFLKTTNDSLNEYISRRNDEESAIFSGNLGLRAGIIMSRWSISTGINYHHQGELIDYRPEFYQWIKNTSKSWNIIDNSYYLTDTNTVSYLVSEGSWQPVDTAITFWNSSAQNWDTQMVSITQYIVDTTYTSNIFNVDSSYLSDLDSTEIIKTDSAKELVNDPSLKTEKLSSKISYVELPLLVGYEIPLGRFSLLTRSGISFGLLTKLNTSYLKDDISGTEQIEISRVNKTMLNYLLHVGVNYFLTEDLMLNFDPFFRMNLTSVLKDSAIDQRYWNAGMNVGLMYRF